MMMWSNMDRRRICTRSASRVRSARSSIVVPTSRMRNSTRSGVTINVVMRRAVSLSGRTSPYPVVVTLTVE